MNNIHRLYFAVLPAAACLALAYLQADVIVEYLLKSVALLTVIFAAGNTGRTA